MSKINTDTLEKNGGRQKRRNIHSSSSWILGDIENRSSPADHMHQGSIDQSAGPPRNFSSQDEIVAVNRAPQRVPQRLSSQLSREEEMANTIPTEDNHDEQLPASHIRPFRTSWEPPKDARNQLASIETTVEAIPQESKSKARAVTIEPVELHPRYGVEAPPRPSTSYSTESVPSTESSEAFTSTSTTGPAHQYSSRNKSASSLHRLFRKRTKSSEESSSEEPSQMGFISIEKRVSFDQQSTVNQSWPLPGGAEDGSWKASDYDTSGLTVEEIHKLKKKGINPALYAEMKAAKKGKKWTPALAGSTFIG